MKCDLSCTGGVVKDALFLGDLGIPRFRVYRLNPSPCFRARGVSDIAPLIYFHHLHIAQSKQGYQYFRLKYSPKFYDTLVLRLKKISNSVGTYEGGIDFCCSPPQKFSKGVTPF